MARSITSCTFIARSTAEEGYTGESMLGPSCEKQTHQCTLPSAKSGQIICYERRTLHMLPTLGLNPVDIAVATCYEVAVAIP